MVYFTGIKKAKNYYLCVVNSIEIYIADKKKEKYMHVLKGYFFFTARSLTYFSSGFFKRKQMFSALVEAVDENEAAKVEDNKRLIVEPEDENVNKKPRLDAGDKVKKRKVAMLLGYLGKNYYGMQRNPGMKTIEEDLIQALFKAKLINDEALETIQTIQFQRAARTDKGVSAARQVVSLKLRKMEIISANKLSL